ncbi:hypothetical protein TPHA_0P01340 [Tetrapisispora phaffii CBS 4417]|uniref:tRNA:m(4)X modification enzyme TRM13 n=1 Tax=Tetrapisispora phaffii (strain ATCC 24235 / CBS 4417 / NBRC 1672 / NRRL Y-8282 / UCD 70-5) TaxID=1071381 RepID=G8C2B4_TETPH|nr:hypothetical protein TPHA_0P01340 [Tetrapisispora phaffii CBS 4417]CCE66292.1 hypothetical protein TPHA_0P01340 [Tetrapisispora phaffii CBS 4417]
MTEPRPKKQRLQCEYIIPNKKRRCGMTRPSNEESKHVRYCLEHRHLLGVDASAGAVTDSRKRVPCPLDPNHTIWEFELAKHLQKCNKRKVLHSNDGEVYYKENHNAGVYSEQGDEEKSNLSLQDCILSTLNILKDFNKENEIVIPKLIKHSGIMEDKRFPQLDENDNIGRKYHAIQQSSLIQNMFDHNILTSASNSNFIEFGCGRAELSRYINQVNQYTTDTDNSTSHFVLIDRSTNRMKFDAKIMADSEEINSVRSNNNKPQIDRIRIDIKDLDITPVLKSNEKYIAISKHLCGVATDLALRCLIGHEKELREDHLQGICIAMCCRHVCNHNSYINPSYIKHILQNHSAGETLTYSQFFLALTKIAPWATSGKAGTGDQAQTHFSKLNEQERFNAGIQARNIIDQGRADWLESRLDEKTFGVKLIRYCESEVTLENNAILVYRI